MPKNNKQKFQITRQYAEAVLEMRSKKWKLSKKDKEEIARLDAKRKKKGGREMRALRAESKFSN